LLRAASFHPHRPQRPRRLILLRTEESGPNTGLRLVEMLALKWDAIDLKAGRLHVREAVAVGIEGTPKSGRNRVMPLNDTALTVLTC